MSATLEITDAAIVILGDFNPPIFSADWLEHNNLIGRDDAATAKAHEKYVVSRAVTSIETGTFSLVVSDKLQIWNRGPVKAPALKDLAIGILTLLPHVPVKAVGLNVFAHYRLPSVDDYHYIGDCLAPKAVWREIFPDTSMNLGMASLTISVDDGVRGAPPRSEDRKLIRVEPSLKYPHGVHFTLNDHHAMRKDAGAGADSAQQCADIVSRLWEPLTSNALEIFSAIIEKVLAAKTEAQNA